METMELRYESCLSGHSDVDPLEISHLEGKSPSPRVLGIKTQLKFNSIILAPTRSLLVRIKAKTGKDA